MSTTAVVQTEELFTTEDTKGPRRKAKTFETQRNEEAETNKIGPRTKTRVLYLKNLTTDHTDQPQCQKCRYCKIATSETTLTLDKLRKGESL